jgi:oxygen-independent coproporphyrinogen-3 oxidase
LKHVHNFSGHEQKFDAVFFGGGTPSLFFDEICEITAFMKSESMLCNDGENCEVTVEANPDDINSTALQKLLQAGVNRISIGVQSLDDDILQKLGRRHDAQTAISALNLAYEAGFKNISFDIMLGIPAQNVKRVCKDISTLSNMGGVVHASAYMYESEFALDDDETALLYIKAVEEFARNGFEQYEISNFCRDSKKCRHNLKYWNCEEYIGIGAAAHSYNNGKRYAVADDLQAFINAPVQETIVTEENPGGFDEKVMLKLRLKSGLLRDEFSEVEWAAILQNARHIPQEYIKIGKNSINLTTNGFLISNRIITQFSGITISQKTV